MVSVGGVEEVAGGVGGGDGQDAGSGVGVEVVVTGGVSRGGAGAVVGAHHVGLRGNGQERITAKVPNL